ncbi:hypothetical protein [Pseudomonas sediminis]|uniref:DUF4760 domain-containing protein n=1 Tax=Pseudomonas sediminis TaxID=1691904 RepID=A0ABX6SKB3_9PSED|nr:hypothetical protein [Pseudomonas sediminis]QNH01580.1 hypothetical protein HNQ25_02290 [Pseudomonas sediminis]
MDSFHLFFLVSLGGLVFLLYRAHKQKIDYEAVCEITQVLRDLAWRNRTDSADANGKSHPYEVLADALQEAQAAIIAKRTFDLEYTSHIQQQLLSSFSPYFLESIGFFRGTERFSRCYSGLSTLARNFERLQRKNTE